MDSSMRVESVDLDQLLLQIDPAALQTNPNLQETLEWMVNEPSGLPPLYEEISSPHSPNGVLDAMGAAPSAWPLPAAFASDDGSAGHIQEDSPTTTAAAGPPRADPKGRAAAAAAAARTEQQKERVRAKNRRAQERYREKKKAERSGAFEALDAVAADLDRLRLENGRLAASNALMEQVLEVRDGVVAALEQERDAQGASPLKLPALLQRLQGAGPGGPECGGGGGGGGGGSPCPLTGLSLSEVAALKAMSPEKVAAHFQGLVRRLGDSLAQVTDPGAAPHTRAAAESEMNEVLWEAGCMCFEHAVLQPTNMQRLLAASVDDGGGGGGGAEEAAEARRWAEITASLELTPGQRAALQPLREAFAERIVRVVAERRGVLRRLQQAPPPPDTLRALQGTTAAWLALHEASAELSVSLEEEHAACMEFVSKAFGGVLTPLQKAKALVASSPAFPDVFSIAAAALEESKRLGEGDPPAAEVAEVGGPRTAPPAGVPA